jgi:hypothetical protein
VLAQAVHRLGAHAAVAQVLGRLAVLGRRHQAEAEDRARRPDHAIEAAPDDLIDVAAHLAPEMLHQPALVAAAQRIALDEALGEAYHADLEALAERQVGGRPERDLDAAAADVDDDRGGAADVDAVAGGEVDEARFLGAGNHLDADAGLAVDLGDEIAAVLRLARGAGGGGDDLVDLVRVGDAAELRHGLERRGHGGGRQVAAVEAARPEADHVFFAVDDLERQIRADLHHDHVDRVGSDIDGGDSHAASSGRASPRAPAEFRYMAVIYWRDRPRPPFIGRF